MLDPGCGSGPLASAFARLAGHVLALEPEPEMLAAAATRANVTWQQGGSATLSPELGRFNLVTMGRSLHWMDRADTLRRLDTVVAAGGAIVLFDDDHPALPDNAWLCDDGAILLDWPFPVLEQVTVYAGTLLSLPTLTVRVLLMSSASRARLGARADNLVAEPAAWFADAAPQGMLHEVVAASALIASQH